MTNTTRRAVLASGGASALVLAFFARGTKPTRAASGSFAVEMSEADWRRRLKPQQFAVLRKEGTETPYSSPLNNEHRSGTFTCAGCDQALFSSSTKFDSGTGWPSFWEPIAGGVGSSTDGSLGMSRTEVHCSRCGGHLGHVFNDGPQPTGLRYCMNGVAMLFRPGSA